MREFLIKWGLFLISLLSVGICMEIAIQNIPNEYKEKSMYLKRELPNIETLILGNSHVLYGIKSEELKDPSFNLGHVSQSIDIDQKLLEKFGSKMPNIKQVIVNLSYFSLRETLATTEEAWRIDKYHQYYDIEINRKWTNAFDLLRLPFNFNITRIKEYYLYGKKEIWITPTGWSNKYNTTNSSEFLKSSGKIAAKSHTVNLAEKGLINKIKTDLDRLAAWCTNRNIKLYLVSMPAHKSYREQLDSTQWNEVISQGHIMENSYPTTYYLNWMADPNFSDEDFHDGDHLSERGAKKLTKRLQAFIDSVEN